MSKNWLKRFLPEPEELKQHKYLRFLGSLLHRPELWRFNRRTVPKAVGIGVFCAFMPMPFQMFLAAVLAIYFYSNLPLAVAVVWLSNPVTMPPMFYVAYALGKYLLGSPELIQSQNGDFSVTLLIDNMNLIWKPFLLGTFICGLFFGIISFYVAKWCWDLATIRKRREQNESRTD